MAQHTYVRELLIRMYGIMHELRELAALSFVVQWCRRGKWYANERADSLAKRAVRTPCPPAAIPRMYQPHAHGVIKTFVKHELAKRRHAVYSAETGKHLLSRLFFSWNLHTDKAFRPRDDHGMLTRRQLRILNMLRTGHSELNFSKHILMHHAHYSRVWPTCGGDINQLRIIQCREDCSSLNNGRCAHCNQLETEEHFLLHCTAHSAIRQRTFGRFFPIYALQFQPINLKNLLFPPLIFRWKHRKMLLQMIVRFAIETQRFRHVF